MERVPAKVLDALAAVPLFSACSRVELRSISRLGTAVEARHGSLLTEQGSSGSEFCLLLAGKARCLVDGRQVAMLEAGDFFGEMALLDRGPRRATVVADGPVSLLVLDAREFGRLLDASPSIARKLLVAFAERTRTAGSVSD
ncbi:MAG TPA: cyclic nucleotide-binding domain-containing protein [Acidimicrobiales bacterium]|nr:cyclic nucleotide-binding domain-containing protein [Acidimicrobiales bacterium]